MSKVLIDRALLERVQERLDPHRDAVLWGDVCDTFRSAPSGTPAMPVKAYYHEWTDLEGVRTRSVGLEVRKELTDAPLVLESDALARIACLEGEIAKRDEELAACRVAVEDCDLFWARIVELESQYQRDVYGLNNEGDPIGGDPAGGYANDNARLRSELAAIKAPARDITAMVDAAMIEMANISPPMRRNECERLIRAAFYAAPVQHVSSPDEREVFEREAVERYGYTWASIYSRRQGLGYSDSSLCMAWIMWQARAMLAAAPAAPAADAGLVEALELAANRLDRLALEQGEFWRGYATAWADEARATANGVKS